ncbi:Alpha/Beta hydrolase protein [Gongronella butleri]|nr:Alpha/Beta hydrolase protein [Gongronella butleri]
MNGQNWGNWDAISFFFFYVHTNDHTNDHRKHYGFEQHLVQTRDDYLLCVHRIPEVDATRSWAPPKQQIVTEGPEGLDVQDFLNEFAPVINDGQGGGRPVVLLYHGFLMSSEIWMCNIDESRNLALLLAQRGYDVWLGNARGNKYSQAHLKLSATDLAFWNFSLNEYAIYDLPDTVDYILSQTGQPHLTYIGFSQGTMQGFSSLSINTGLNKKINLFIALAPATTPAGLHHPLIDAFVKAAPSIIYLIFGRRMPLAIAMFWQRMVSPPMFVKIIDICTHFLFGWTGRNMSPAQKIVSYQHLYSATSVKSLVHWFQIIRTGQFQMFDEMPSRLPFKRVSSVTDHVPPKFPTRQIKAPIALFYGGSDSLVNIDVLLGDLPRPLAYIKKVEQWEHLDFVWANDIESLVYPDIFKLLDHFNPVNPHSSRRRSKV